MRGLEDVLSEIRGLGEGEIWEVYDDARELFDQLVNSSRRNDAILLGSAITNWELWPEFDGIGFFREHSEVALALIGLGFDTEAVDIPDDVMSYACDQFIYCFGIALNPRLGESLIVKFIEQVRTTRLDSIMRDLLTAALCVQQSSTGRVFQHLISQLDSQQADILFASFTGTFPVNDYWLSMVQRVLHGEDKSTQVVEAAHAALGDSENDALLQFDWATMENSRDDVLASLDEILQR